MELRQYSTTEDSKIQFLSSLKVKVPKLPNFDEKNDNMDSYLSRFERYDESHKLDKAMWCLHLSTLLKEKALDVYCRFPSDDASNYDLLKTALLKRFELTE
ncbi:hypothetical protein DPMN_155039 [Dreissena polymorpha]|uniref:Uncharacterized protein n=1 Tax=Dreissena polymorpha TaxID=45954 RepID=A0A9D4FRY4_DREPO|nr:hypothetical protein DPMN_155039 [Dreissena polymorpha]